MYPNSKRKGVDEVATNAVEPSRPAAKKQRGGRTGDDDVVAGPSTARVHDDILGIDEMSTSEQHGRRSTAVAKEVKREQTESIKEEDSVASHTVRLAKKEELCEIKDEETESSSSLNTALTTSGQRQQRSAAPSPFSSAHSTTTSRRFIIPEEVPSIVMGVLTPSAQNPGRCPCGWYQFYAVCTRLYQTEAFKCGARRSRSGVTVFCGSPAPRHNIDNYIVNRPCPRCPDAAPVVPPNP
ncbi:hypothetical protein NLG97_g5318 [Lecanicillium saksenae]|uniref:Uncharacterized protein n=1 Tax=Lecanicillium saksenae TaxID=468837 RepID=A0ACC1QTZ2_9HYPO|nr:hypothetical protein NLG97_g5318 [Lecanicillium saksenae]